MPVADRVAQSQYPRAIAATTALLINSHTARCGWCYAYLSEQIEAMQRLLEAPKPI